MLLLLIMMMYVDDDSSNGELIGLRKNCILLFTHVAVQFLYTFLIVCNVVFRKKIF